MGLLRREGEVGVVSDFGAAFVWVRLGGSLGSWRGAAWTVLRTMDSSLWVVEEGMVVGG